MSRWIAFFLSILLGLAAGLYYGWVVSPVEYVNTTPDTLRMDYKTDFVLMVAEIYQADGEIEQAVRALALLGDADPLELTSQAMAYAEANQYGQSDQTLLTRLRAALQTRNPADAPAAEGAP
jgi:hypothetical protein